MYPLENSNDAFVVVTNLIFKVDTNKIKVELQDASTHFPGCKTFLHVIHTTLPKYITPQIVKEVCTFFYSTSASDGLVENT